ncbi:MAG: Lrp/AsnC family transcriptional regulator [Caldilineaceae bacterium]
MKDENTTLKLDEIDREILRILQSDGNLSNVELSERVNLSPTPCLRRVKRMEEAGLISGYRADVDRRMAGFPIMAFIHITLNQQVESALEVVEAAVKERPEIINCYLITGDSDYIFHVVVESLDAYADLMRNHLTRIPAIRNIKTSFVLESIVTNRPIPV